MSTPQTAYHVSAHDWRAGKVVIQADGEDAHILTQGELQAAAIFSDMELRPIYRTLARRAVIAIEDARQASVRQCSGHVAIHSRDRCYTGPVSRDENPAAHGGICQIETCRCGAERQTNINGRHIEQGRWL